MQACARDHLFCGEESDNHQQQGEGSMRGTDKNVPSGMAEKGGPDAGTDLYPEHRFRMAAAL